MEAQLRTDKPMRSYPFNIPAIASLSKMEFSAPVTFFIGENGSGKSTLLEALAVSWGFNPEGGSINMRFSTYQSHSPLWENIKLIMSIRRPADGYFLRAERFYNVASYIEELDSSPAAAPPIKRSYGGSLHEKSHGESFSALLFNRLGGNGLYLFDEPEAALSITGQLSALRRIHELAKNGSQLIIATHSPILLSCPNSEIFQFSQSGIVKVRYEDTDIYRTYKYFLNNPSEMLRELLK